MYAHLEDELLDHPKISVAGRLIGKNGVALALGVYVHALLYCNRHLTDGDLAVEVIESWRLVLKPLDIAEALEAAGLFDKTDRGYRIHDYKDYNPLAADIKKRRKAERHRKAEYRARTRRGNGPA